MTHTHYRHVEQHFDARIVAAREGIVETAFYLRNDLLGEPWFYRLATNSYSMSATSADAQRYMRLVAYLPAALHPRIESALVICFGVGSTASAVTDLPDVRRIDVVDVSRDILELSDIAFPDPQRHPLRDSRVTVHVEDGRFYLQQTARRYDLITGEPPPPSGSIRVGWRPTGCRCTNCSRGTRWQSSGRSATPSRTARSGPA
jgi:spermidine synthase